MATHVLLIGGRSGSGKTQAATELHALLKREDVRHAVIEGDHLDLAHPAPWEHHLAERNLAAIWANYRELGYARLIYTNTVAPLQAAELAAAMGDDPVVTAVLLTASNDTAYARLSSRESGDELLEHLRRSEAASARLDQECPPGVVRIDTNGRSSSEVAEDIRDLLPW
jgi:thymidylate kinase